MRRILPTMVRLFLILRNQDLSLWTKLFRPKREAIAEQDSEISNLEVKIDTLNAKLTTEEKSEGTNCDFTYMSSIGLDTPMNLLVLIQSCRFRYLKHTHFYLWNLLM